MLCQQTDQIKSDSEFLPVSRCSLATSVNFGIAINDIGNFNGIFALRHVFWKHYPLV